MRDIIGHLPEVSDFAALALMITSKGAYFIADTEVRSNPSADELCEIAALAARHVQRFNLKPKIAFLSHSDFGSYDTDSSRKMRHACRGGDRWARWSPGSPRPARSSGGRRAWNPCG